MSPLLLHPLISLSFLNPIPHFDFSTPFSPSPPLNPFLPFLFLHGSSFSHPPLLLLSRLTGCRCGCGALPRAPCPAHAASSWARCPPRVREDWRRAGGVCMCLFACIEWWGKGGGVGLRKWIGKKDWKKRRRGVVNRQRGKKRCNDRERRNHFWWVTLW